jgi:predicted DNA-binding protein (MmcQ/YjbR family)
MDVEQVRERCLSLPRVTEDFPFDETTLVFRVCGKIFVLLNLERMPPSFNAKCEPGLAVELRELHEAIHPGWHMNKRHWNTVVLDGTLPVGLPGELITHAYLCVVKGLTRAERAWLGELPADPLLGRGEG